MRSTIKCDIICRENILQKELVSDMKTKIIYISGGEIFNVRDVRDAFDTVRKELRLGSDTVFFGVPVDTDDALAGQFESVQMVEKADEQIPETPEPIVEPQVAVEQVVTAKPKRSRKKVVATEQENVTEQKPTDTEKVTAEVIPILSVLGGDTKAESDTVAEENTPEKTKSNDIDLSVIVNETEIVVQTENSNNADDSHTDFETSDIDTPIPTVEPEPATIQDSDEEDQLEKLLQSVQSLHEDKEDVPELKVVEAEPDETDATLEKLATEFAENQDKIVNTTKTNSRGGRIGKLKNILPFKKAKSNEPSLMGDLFGWAGAAANDEEFGIPEFFPTR